MALTTRLDQRQSQSLVMTPQLQQAIKLLQMSNMELRDFITEELEQNPILEREEILAPDTPYPEDVTGKDLSNVNGEDPGALETIDFNTPASAELSTDSGLDIDYENIYTSNGLGDDQTLTEIPNYYTEPILGETNYSGSGGYDLSAPNLEQTICERPALRDHLINQLSLEFSNEIHKTIGLFLIENLDDAGYLTVGVQEVATSFNCDESLVTNTLTHLQNFDPPGIFARDLRECLALQLKDKNRLDPCMMTFLDNLDLLAAHRLKKLEHVCQCDTEDITDMIQEIRSLSPKPALAFDQNITPPVIPDVLMRPAPDKSWIIELNSETLPRVIVNNHYYARVRKKARTKHEKSYIAEQFQSANWLIKALHQRATTIMKVSTEIVRQQELFFAHGVRYLKPLVLRDIADSIEMHESTVSRVTSNKYMATPRGMFELKYFFTPAIPSSGGGDAHSAEAVRHRIKILIDAEPPNKIISDDKIVALLKADGVEVARRTVAKYREAMRIPSSVQRRREKAPLITNE